MMQRANPQTTLKRLITWAYGWHLISARSVQRLINRFKLWRA